MANTVTSAASYISDSLSPSFQQSLATDLVNAATSGGGAQAALSSALSNVTAGTVGNTVSNLASGSGLGDLVTTAFGPNAPDLAGALGFDSSQFLGGLGGSQQPAWTFITAPEDVSWDIANQASRIDMFGTNNPPVVAGSRGMRDLTLSNSLVEGFIRNVNVEAKVAALENLMNYSLNSSDGFVSVPVYQVWASEKSYGGPTGYFIIKDVRVKETMRDLTGNTTRAYVDVSFMQVPEYQVNSGRDQASATTSGAKSGLLSQAQTSAAQQANAAAGQTPAGAAGAAAGAAANQGVGTPAKPAAGPSSAQPASSPTGFQGPGGRGAVDLGL